MTSSAWPDHLLDLDEWDALPEDASRRFELVEGVLLVSPRPRLRHQETVTALAAPLRAALPGDLRAVTEIEVVLDDGSPPTVRVPDIAVLPATSLDDRARCAAAELVGVVEVLSPGTMRTDRVAKMAEYADARIPFYGIVDPARPVVLSEFRLVPGAQPHYDHVADHRGHATLPLGALITVALDPAG